MASPTPSLESRANSLGSLASLSPLTVSGSSPPASDSAICDVDTCDLCLDSAKPGDAPCPRCRLGGAGGNGVRCTGCKSTESDAVARCFDCANFLCPNCVMAHQFMHCFEGHRVLNLGDSKLDSTTGNNDNKNNLVVNGGGTNGEKILFCPRHKSELLKYFCRHCTVPVCKECTISDHPAPLHDCAHISEVGPQQLEAVARIVQECRAKAADVRAAVKAADHGAARLQVQYHKAQNEINDTFQFYRSMLEERKQELLKELESVFSAKQISLGVVTQKANEMADKIHQTCEFVERLTKHTTVTEVLMVKKLLDSKLQILLSYSPDIANQNADLEFVSNYQAIQVGVRNTFGYVRSNNESNAGPSKQPPIARPTSLSNGSSNNSSGPGSAGSLGGLLLDRPYSNGLVTSTNCVSTSPSPFENNSVISKRFSSANSLGPFSTTISDLGMNPYEKWSNGGNDAYPVSVTANDHFPLPAVATVTAAPGDSVLDLTSKLMSSAAIFPPKSQIKRQKMIYHCKFGEFGVMEGQFTEPSGVAVNAQNDIIVADTNNHRIQIFDKEGRFKFQFGECGKRDGQLLYPNRVAVVRTSGDIIVTERSPTHQIQIYNQYGQFVRKFGANILQHPRGVTVDSKGRIVVVECKVMRVIIFDQGGNVLQKFGCSKHLEFPNGVVVNDKQEIFISDNRAHCVKVFNYEGAYLRQIGGEGITNYPIGVGINAAGEILIADNHNNFNLTIFTQDGHLVSALESKVKHAQCFDVALMDDGSVVLASKDYRLYIYRYVQVPPIGM
ncbi:brain tumor protein-like [Leptopilina boulardi]|uniref:brain tumor protein-like n=1 Tax=Leptopilina boulardi TaxID=63433 RepID=UPI0021F6160B|nr:brain tumor protein-like [Leptopilina boulardi]XP_051165941.1 brain tumor protein-like [Leptopilina boulardi]XP_051165942.1 brain tumor protein-like [Leptopilina boulardi]XP_051165943.1 brain tumor protein-like [Leptopilina boulardi]XP_051165944.1 brain tumor protein-like [Leptopilina boulardi]XP_051165945.1 brain tumor protein-like [Leptopilina boulardi]